MSVIQLIKRGKELFDSGKYADAYSEFVNALANLTYGGKEGEVLKNDIIRLIGITEIKLGMYDKAIERLKGLTMVSDSPEVLYYLSLAQYYYSFFESSAQKRLELLKSALQLALSVYERTKLGNSLIAVILAEMGQLEKAEKFAKNSVLARAKIYEVKGELNVALNEIEKADKGDIDAQIEKALILAKMGNTGEALVTLNYVEAVEPTNSLAKLYKAELLESLGRTYEAYSIYKELDKTLYSPLVKLKLDSLSKQVSPVIESSKKEEFSSRLFKRLKPLKWDPRKWIGETFDGMYDVIELIGEGGSSYVLKARTPGGNIVAIKVFKIFEGISEDYFDNLINEAGTLTNLSKNKNIVEIYAASIDRKIIEGILRGNIHLYRNDPPRIVTEYIEGGTMSQLLSDDRYYYSPLWAKTVYRAIASVANALTDMHKLGLIHGDIKPQKIFLTRKVSKPEELNLVEFKLDLGAAARIGSKISQATIEFAPPEVFIDTAKPYIDIFSLGLTMYSLLSRKLDRPDMPEMEGALICYQNNDLECVKNQVNNAKNKLAIWDPQVPLEVKPLLKSMISPNPIQRPTAADVFNYLLRLF